VASAKGKGRRDGRKSAAVDNGKRGGCGCSGTAVVRKDRGARGCGRGLDRHADTEAGARGYKWRGDGTGEAAHDREARSRWTPNVSRWMEMGLERA
jgi:hypothetical protein